VGLKKEVFNFIAGAAIAATVAHLLDGDEFFWAGMAVLYRATVIGIQRMMRS